MTYGHTRKLCSASIQVHTHSSVNKHTHNTHPEQWVERALAIHSPHLQSLPDLRLEPVTFVNKSDSIHRPQLPHLCLITLFQMPINKTVIQSILNFYRLQNLLDNVVVVGYFSHHLVNRLRFSVQWFGCQLRVGLVQKIHFDRLG